MSVEKLEDYITYGPLIYAKDFLEIVKISANKIVINEANKDIDKLLLVKTNTS